MAAVLREDRRGPLGHGGKATGEDRSIKIDRSQATPRTGSEMGYSCNTLRSSTLITTVISLFMVITVAYQAMITLIIALSDSHHDEIFKLDVEYNLAPRIVNACQSTCSG